MNNNTGGQLKDRIDKEGEEVGEGNRIRDAIGEEDVPASVNENDHRDVPVSVNGDGTIGCKFCFQ